MIKHILVIDADPKASNHIRQHLQDDSTDILYASTTQEALIFLKSVSFVLIMVEIGQIGADDYPLVEAVKRLEPIPIWIFYANAGLKNGNDTPVEDILKSPLDLSLCLDTAKELLERRIKKNGGDERSYIIAAGPDLVIDPAARTASLCDEDLELSQKQFDMLYYLATHPGQAVSKSELFEYIGGGLAVEADNSIAIYISNLRKKLRDDPANPQYIKTVHGIGYRFRKD